MKAKARPLRVGERVHVTEGGPTYRVTHVNECRARLVCEGKRQREIHDRITGELTATFEVPATPPLDVSPYSIVERVA